METQTFYYSHNTIVLYSTLFRSRLFRFVWSCVVFCMVLGMCWIMWTWQQLYQSKKSIDQEKFMWHRNSLPIENGAVFGTIIQRCRGIPVCGQLCATLNKCDLSKCWKRLRVSADLIVWMNELVNEWMNCITYIPPVKPEGQAQRCILRRSMVINPLGMTVR